MKIRTLLIAVIALAILTFAGYTIRNSSLHTPEEDPLVGQPILDTEALAHLNAIEISKGEDRVLLQINEEGKWVVSTLYNLPVDFGKLNTFAKNIVDARIGRKITGRQDRLERLDLNQGTVKLTSGDGTSLLDITYGKSLSGGGKAFQFGNEKTAYLATASPFVDTNSTNWAVKTLYEFEADDVAGIQFSLAGETWGVRRDDKDKDFVSTTPSDERTPKESKITSVISQFSNPRFTKVNKREEVEATVEWKGAQENSRSLRVTLFSGENITVKMSQYSPPESEDEEDSTTSTADEVTYLHISSSQADHPINSLMDELVFEGSSYTFGNIPAEISELADLPEEPEPGGEKTSEDTPEPEGPASLPVEATTTVEEIDEDQASSAQP